jgi:hypothetical protein
VVSASRPGKSPCELAAYRRIHGEEIATEGAQIAHGGVTFCY